MNYMKGICNISLVEAPFDLIYEIIFLIYVYIKEGMYRTYSENKDKQ